MANNGLPYLPFYVNDFASDGKVEAMSTLAVGSYILLLCKAWREDPPASIPDNDPTLARWARITLDQWLGIKSEVLAAFSLGTDLRWHQKRLRSEYDKLTCLKNHKSEIARSAAKTRWLNEKHADALPSQSKSKADDMPSEYESVFESLWKDYPIKDGKKESYKHFCASVKSEQDVSSIRDALGNYLRFVAVNKTEPQYIKRGKTWFNNWKDWIEWKEPEPKSLKSRLVL